MTQSNTLFVLSDVHYSCAAERERGVTEFQVIQNPLLRLLVRGYRHFIWRRDPFAHNHRLDQFIAGANGADFVVANGDYSCDTAFIGLSDPASYESAGQCIARLRSAFGASVGFTIGDHELGKTSLFGGNGGLRLASFSATKQLGLESHWTRELDDFVLVGVTSSLIALPVYEPEALPDERGQWRDLREHHLSEIRKTFRGLDPGQKVLLFCHDPTALPYLAEEPEIRSKLNQIAVTLIGHLHSNLYLWQSRLLAGMPPIRFLGNSIRRMSTALNQARCWKAFQTRLCPSLGGIELLDDGGYFQIQLLKGCEGAMNFRWHPLPRKVGAAAR
ncbi:MAG: hypothetical protein EXS31_19185 [Pedosphaera sp.]|nr:hypothetical protein [Pedosphaera sp.]